VGGQVISCRIGLSGLAGFRGETLYGKTALPVEFTRHVCEEYLAGETDGLAKQPWINRQTWCVIGVPNMRPARRDNDVIAAELVQDSRSTHRCAGCGVCGTLVLENEFLRVFGASALDEKRDYARPLVARGSLVAEGDCRLMGLSAVRPIYDESARASRSGGAAHRTYKGDIGAPMWPCYAIGVRCTRPPPLSYS